MTKILGSNLSSWLLKSNFLNLKLKENEVSKLLITTTVSDNLLIQILRQINKLIDVLIAKEEIE